jgi:myosin-5
VTLSYGDFLPIAITWLSVLHTIRNRYAQHSIYTYSGIVLIAVNPFQRVTLYGPEIIQAYSGRKRGELEPHLFAIAEDAYTAMRKEGMGQTIIVSGERYARKRHHHVFTKLISLKWGW